MKQTVNQIHKNYIGDATPFKDWINVEKYWFQETKPVDYSFPEWLHKKYEMNGKDAWFNVDGEVIDKNKEVISWFEQGNQLLGNVADMYGNYTDLHNQTAENQAEAIDKNSKTTKKILGINPYLFWGGLLVIGGVTAVFTYKKLKK